MRHHLQSCSNCTLILWQIKYVLPDLLIIFQYTKTTSVIPYHKTSTNNQHHQTVMKLSIIACTLFASLLSTVSARSVNINDAPPYVGCQRDCAAVYVKDRNLANLKQCHSNCFRRNVWSAYPYFRELLKKHVPEWRRCCRLIFREWERGWMDVQ